MESFPSVMYAASSRIRMGVSSVGFRNFSNGVGSKFMTEWKSKGAAATEEKDADVSQARSGRVEARALHRQCDRSGRFVLQPIATPEQPLVTTSLHLPALRGNDRAHRYFPSPRLMPRSRASCRPT